MATKEKKVKTKPVKFTVLTKEEVESDRSLAYKYVV